MTKASAGALAVLAVAALAILGFRTFREPSYAGKPFSFWCDRLPFTEQVSTPLGSRFARAQQYSRNGGEQQQFSETEQQALAAIDALGTNCLPGLLARLRRRNSPLVFESRKLAARLGLIKRTPVGIWHVQRMRALTGIIELGSRAKVIEPELTALKTDADPWLRAAASYALNQMASQQELDLRLYNAKAMSN